MRMPEQSRHYTDIGFLSYSVKGGSPKLDSTQLLMFRKCMLDNVLS